jgi:predicted amidohydrolase YtcJ
MWIAMAREARYVDEAIYPEESLNMQQALQMYTLNAAYALSREHDLGSLEVGKLADFVVIDRDILNSAVDDIRDTKVLQTYLGGELVYQSEYVRRQTLLDKVSSDLRDTLAHLG